MPLLHTAKTWARIAKVFLWLALLTVSGCVADADNTDASAHDKKTDAFGMDAPFLNLSAVPAKDLNDSIPFRHFIAHNKTMTCTADEHARPFNNQIRGVNLGGWMVLEPWITPSLFYQFLNQGENTTAFDMYSFCEVLGPEEANRQLRRHWETWVTEDIIKQLAESGAVNSLRLPVGDFMYRPYGPYHGCVDGSLDYVDNLLDWAYSHGLSVLIDIHTAKDSQNGFDNSGKTMGFRWTSNLNSEFSGLTTFEHWPIRSAAWVGDFDPQTASYSSINYANIQHSLKVVLDVVTRYAEHPAVLGLEPLNEPWQYTPIDTLKRFYWEGYLIVKLKAPFWKYVMHDGFRFGPDFWGGFMEGCPERALDTHIYQAWRDPDSRIGFFTDACQQKSNIATMERAFGPVIVGEWSLATDNCAMWLNGFNDNLPGFPRLPCKFTPCAEPYMGPGQPGTPVDPSKPIQGPYGSGLSGPVFGLCPGSRDWRKETSDNPLTGQDWIRAPPNIPKVLDDTDNVMQRLAMKKIDAFSGIGHGFYFWNFRTDLYEPQWSYMAALERGWIPRGNLAGNEKILNACLREDKGAFRCILKRGQIDRAIRSAMDYILNAENRADTPEGKAALSKTGKDLEEAAKPILSDYFEQHRLEGATCDFGGIAMLVEENRTISDDDSFGFSDDEYFLQYESGGPPLWLLIIGGTVVALLGGCLGFVMAMRFNPRFNDRIRHTSLFKPITSSKSMVIRSSLNLPSMYYEDLNDIDTDEHKSTPNF
jgi:glucan 1,3-beta-glucosidase